MLDKTSDIAIAAESWLAEFEAALGSDDALEKLFHADSYWRDALALSWTLQTVNGRDDILKTSLDHTLLQFLLHFYTPNDNACY